MAKNNSNSGQDLEEISGELQNTMSIQDFCNSKPFTDRDKYSFSKIFSTQEPKTSQDWEALIQDIA